PVEEAALALRQRCVTPSTLEAGGLGAGHDRDRRVATLNQHAGALRVCTHNLSCDRLTVPVALGNGRLGFTFGFDHRLTFQFGFDCRFTFRFDFRFGFGLFRFGLWRRLFAGYFFPTVPGASPGMTELEVATHRYFELNRLDAEPRHDLGLLARRDRAVEAVVHLKERNDALAPDRAHPELGVTCRRALDQRVQGVVAVGAVELTLAEPLMCRIRKPVLGLLALARSGALLPFAAGDPQVEMPAGAVVERDIAVLTSEILVRLAELTQERHLAIVLSIELVRFLERQASHLSKFADPGTVNLSEVGSLGRLPRETGELCRQLMKVGVRIIAIARDRNLGLGHAVERPVVHGEPELLL